MPYDTPRNRPRKLFVFMDGTGNEIGDAQTNVLKLYRSLQQDEQQLGHYIMGVGTNDSASPQYRPFQYMKAGFGLAFGLGLEGDMMRAYKWLAINYRSSRQYRQDWLGRHRSIAKKERPPKPEFHSDRIYIVGFSRGAYAARMLAGFIHNFGIVDENNVHLATPAFRAYRSLTKRDHADPARSRRYRKLRQFEFALKPRHKAVRALLLFDTVASMIRLDWPWFTIPDYRSLANVGVHASTDENPSVRIVVHAMAIDERRTFFRNFNWIKSDYYGNRFRRPYQKRSQFLRQRWFAGFHSDIGGSPPEREAGIGKITALWMLRALAEQEAKADAEDMAAQNERRTSKGQTALPPYQDPQHGMRLTGGNEDWYFRGLKSKTNAADIPYCGPDHLAETHNSVFSRGWKPSVSWIWLILEFLPPKYTGRRAKGAVALFRRLWPYYIPMLEPRHIPNDHEVDASVWMRKADTGYNPPNLRGRQAKEGEDFRHWIREQEPLP
ncbi:MAG: DUF2235 domain-containing protein [Rhodobacteraceae bacterium]|nr:DUF2235 domain-containing protein [Paracoccaceae bacterium]